MPPAPRLFVTPARDVDVTCRLTLASYLSSLGSSLPAGIMDTLLRRPVPSEGGDWRACRTVLEELTIVDPACGEGHFLAGMLDVLDELLGYIAVCLGDTQSRPERRRGIATQSLYGVEVDGERLVLAAARLSAGASMPSDSPLNLVRGDSLVEGPGFTWARAFPRIAARGGFDLVIGNPPYLRHELIRDPASRLTPGTYRDLARISTYRRFAEFFRWDEHTGNARRPLDRRSDLSLLFLFLGFWLLRAEGALGFVVPTALFQAGYGHVLESFLASSARRGIEVRSETRRSFAAPVNTSVLVASNSHARPEGGCIEQISIQGPLSEECLDEIWQAAGRRQEMTQCRDRRVGPSGWPAYRTVPLGTIGQVRYAIKTGLNAFFYPSLETVARFNIEPQFLFPVLKSPRQVLSIRIEASKARTLLFVCSLPEHELAGPDARGALAYIEWAGAQVTAGRQKTVPGIPWPDVPSLRGRRPWYSITLPRAADILCPRFFDRRFFFAAPAGPLAEDQTFYGLVLGDQTCRQRELVAAILNSSLTYLAVERGGRSGLGDGVRQFALADVASLPFLDPLSVPTALIPRIVAAYERLATRPILPIGEEVMQGDRHSLDAAIGEAAGVCPSEMENVRAMLADLTHRRIARSRSMR